MNPKPLISRQFQTFTIGMTVVALLLAALALPWNAHPAQAVATKIMPLGDSITGSTCWRARLWNRLQSGGYTNVDFVGTLNTAGCPYGAYDGNNEGHGGYLVINVANQNLLPPWLSATNPDIVLMHFGTNDVWNQVSTANILAAYSTLVDQMRANNPNMKIIVAQIIPMDPSGCGTCYQGVINLNNAIPGWASGKSTAQSPIYVVDQWTGFDVAADTVDRVHPNDTSGSTKMGDKWYTALTPLLSTGPTPTNTLPPTATSTNPPGTTSVDDSVQGTGQNQFNYVGTGWSHCTNCNEGGAAIYYNSSQSWNITTNDSVTIAFTGTQIKYYAVKAPDVGIAAVSIDGGTETNVDLYMMPKTGNVLVWTSATLASGSHTFKVRNTGTKNASSTGTTITLDRVDIISGGPTNTPAPPTATATPSQTPTRTNTPVPPTATNTPVATATPTATTAGTVTVDDSVQGTGQNQFNYVGTGWSHCTNCNEGGAAIYYNSSQSWNNVTNSYVTIAFTGTQIKYYAVKAPDVGIAAVSIDGGAETNIDLYMTPKTGNVLVWTSATLTNGSHTFKVRNTGTKNASSSGTTITLDRVDILSNSPTATPTLTNTPVPPTATWTNTPLGPTNTPTRTNTPTSNLLTNPGFESGTTGWSCNGCTGSAVTSPVFAGTQAYQAAARTAAWAGPLQDVTSKVTNGQVRNSEVWVRLPSGTANARITLELTTSTGMTWITLAPNTAVNSTGWTKVSGSATVSWSGTLNTARWFVETDTGTTTFYIDEAKMTN